MFKRILWTFCCIAVIGGITAADSGITARVSNAVQHGFAERNAEKRLHIFEKGLSSLETADEKITAFRVIALYEEQMGYPLEATAYYRKAAELDTLQAPKLFLAAVRGLLSAGYYQEARSLLQELPFYHADTGGEYSAAAAAYEVWIFIAEQKFEAAFPLIKTYLKNSRFKAYHPAMLFTLWWVDVDAQAAVQLLSQYPETMEAAALRGELVIQPSLFWYLMPKTDRALYTAASPEARNKIEQQITESCAAHCAAHCAAQTADSKESAQAVGKTAGLVYQVGFYKIKKYADRMVKTLQQKGFSSFIREETRPSGTVYFAVLVPENEENTIGEQLHNAGYEAFPTH